MNKWNFVVKELKSLQQEFSDHQAIVELYVEQILLRGYNIKKDIGQIHRS
jgi:hypothetical protein